MRPFSKFAPNDAAELKAVIFAVVFCGMFIAFLTAMHPPGFRKVHRRSSDHLTIPTPMRPEKLLEPEPQPFEDSNERFRKVPENFKYVDFRNHSYGFYGGTNGRQIDLTLTESELQLPNNAGWFSLRDVYYKDVTGDGKAEAIVRLSHVKCGGSCDGGADIFYIYKQRNGHLENIWQYETGSYGYGCGLKSFTIAGNQVVLELFGHCPKPAMDDPGPSKFVVKNMTFLLFTFNGQRFVREVIEFLPMEPTNVKNFEPRTAFY